MGRRRRRRRRIWGVMRKAVDSKKPAKWRIRRRFREAEETDSR